jgi:hypothetical protein
MKSMQKYLIVWLSGLVAGFMLMERWQRSSGLPRPEAENVGEAVATDAATTPVKVSADQPKVSAVIVAGAKSDAERARRLLVQAMPWRSTSAPSLAKLRRSGQTAMSGNTPDRPV